MSNYELLYWFELEYPNCTMYSMYSYEFSMYSYEFSE
jgi:hypothetical protein